LKITHPPRLSTMRTTVGIFMSEKDQQKIYNKPALNEKEQLELLLSRGLVVSNHQRARHYLQFIGYYRLSGYALFYQDRHSHNFYPNTNFDDILNLYIFDRELRLLVMDAVERIEVAIRACISNSLSLKHGSHWFLKPELFIPSYRHDLLAALINLSS